MKNGFRRIVSLVRRRTRLVISALLLLAFGSGVLVTLIAQNPSILYNRVSAFLPKQKEFAGDTRLSEWNRRHSVLESFDVAEVDLGALNPGVNGGGIDWFEGLVVFVTSTGHIGSFDTDTLSIQYEDLRVPMDYVRVRNDILLKNPRFEITYYRVLDAMVHTDGNGAAWLYVSHHQMAPSDEDLCTVVHRVGITRTSDGIELDKAGWEHVYTVADCFNLPEISWHFRGHLSGGRMLPYDGDTFLYTVGNYNLSRLPGGFEKLTSEDTDFSRLLQIDMRTKTSRVFAMGIRNSLGMVIDDKGNLWQSSIGPLAGDELNLVVEGGHYGFPHVTLGMQYGNPRAPWPFSDAQGRHEGYTPPVFAFLPSVAPTQMTQVPSDSEFALWRGDLLLNTLRAKSLYRLRLDGDRLIAAEPIEMGHRLRDMIWTDDGQLVLFTDSEKLLIIRPADPNSPETSQSLEVSGYEEIRRREEQVAKDLLGYRSSWGRDVFISNCAQCHYLDGEPAPGPNLVGIVGAGVRHDPGFGYSMAFTEADGVWSRARLRRFLADPQSEVPGALMPGFGNHLTEEEIEQVIKYLQDTDEVK